MEHLSDEVPHDSELLSIQFLLKLLMPNNSVYPGQSEQKDDNRLNLHGTLVVIELCNCEFKEFLIEDALLRREKEEVCETVSELVIFARDLLAGIHETLPYLVVEVSTQAYVLGLEKLG